MVCYSVSKVCEWVSEQLLFVPKVVRSLWRTTREAKILTWNGQRSGSSSAKTKLSCMKTELKRCIMSKSLWNKYDISCKSSEVPVKPSPKVVRKERALALNAPWDSTAIGWKIYELVRLVYFASLRLADRAEDDRYEAASVLTMFISNCRST